MHPEVLRKLPDVTARLLFITFIIALDNPVNNYAEYTLNK